VNASVAAPRTERGRKVAAIAIALASTAALAIAWGAAFVHDIPFEPSAIGLGFAGVTFGLVGAVIIARVEGNRLGWVFGGISVAMTLSGFQSVARPLLEAGMNTSMVAVGQGLADASFSTMLFLVLVITPSWFPTGRPITRRWGWPNLPAAVAWSSIVFMALLAPEKKILWDPFATDEADMWRSIPNPIGVAFFPDFEESNLANVAALVMLAAGVIAVASLVVRFRRSAVVERAQIRLLMATFLVLIPTIAVSVVLGDRSTGFISVVFEVLFGAAILAVPLAAGVAIAKYRLYIGCMRLMWWCRRLSRLGCWQCSLRGCMRWWWWGWGRWLVGLVIRVLCCRLWRWRWWRWCSSRCGGGCSIGRMCWCMGRGRRRMRCCLVRLRGLRGRVILVMLLMS